MELEIVQIAEEEKIEEPGMGWIVSYADLMTLLFAVFVVLYGLKPEGISDTISKPVIAAAIRNAFTTTPDIIPDDRTLKPTVSKKTNVSILPW